MNKQIVNPYINDLCLKLQNAELNKELERLNLASVSELDSYSHGTKQNVKFSKLFCCASAIKKK
jgi:hypothetical protein